MNRRDFLFTGLAAGLTVPVLAHAAFAAPPAGTTPDIHVVYVGGWDCPYCIVWKNEYKANWIASETFKKVRWTEVDPPHLREAYQERYWQGELVAIREQLPKKSGTPRFVVVRDGKVVSNELGVNKWENSVVVIRSLLG
jgi:hypothetical protein